MPPTKKQKREAMPPEYVKGPGKPGQLHPHLRKSFPDDEEDADGRGKVVQVPDALRLYGEWRRVPGFWKMLASDKGFIMTEGELHVRQLKPNYYGYLRVFCNDRSESVHLLVGRAFHGLPTSDQVSIDHKDQDKLNNSSTNLKWATPTEQRVNQGNRKEHSSGEPCIVWKVKGRKVKHDTSMCDMTRVDGTEEIFDSAGSAAKTLGLVQGTLSKVLNEKCKTVVGPDGSRYTGKWHPDLANLENEDWKEIPIKTRNRLFVSNYGRTQRIYPSGRKGTKHYPEALTSDYYLYVTVDGSRKPIHELVGNLFFIGPKPRNWSVYDHKDQDKQNNHISNLRPVTSEENALNTAAQRDFYLWPVGEPDDWIRCVSQRAAARTYNIDRASLYRVLHKRRQMNGSASISVNGYCAAFVDEV